jgi:hypothetical protein
MRIAAIDFGSLEDIASPNFAGGEIGDIISSALRYLFPITGFALLIYLVLGGYKYLTSMGNPKKIEAAKSNITWAIVGFIVVFIAYWIVQIIGMALGLEAISNLFG